MEEIYSDREIAGAKRTVLLTCLDFRISIQDLKHHFSQYGRIEYVKIEDEQATIRFEDKQTAFDVISTKHHVLNGCKIIADQYYLLPQKSFHIKFDTEDQQSLTDEYPITSVLDELLAAHTVSEQIHVLSESLRLSDEDLSERENIRSYFQNLFSQYFTYSDVCLFGSSSNGLGVMGCDVELLLSLRTEEEDSVATILPDARQTDQFNALLQIVKEKSRKLNWSELSCLNEYDIILLIIEIIREQNVICTAIELIPVMKCPIVHFIYDGGVACEVSMKNRLVVLNSSLIKLYTEIDSRVDPLLIIIRTWFINAKLEISTVIRFNSYCTTLLVLHYLQQRSPPVIPTVEELRRLECETRIIASVNCSFCQDLTKIQPCNNEESVRDLLNGFFIYYDKFNFAKLAIDCFTGKAVKIEELIHSKPLYKVRELNLLDPFDQAFSVASNINFDLIRRFKDALSIACTMSADDNSWNRRLGLDWGIVPLIDANEYIIAEENYYSRKRSLEAQEEEDCTRIKLFSIVDVTKPGKSSKNPTIEETFTSLCSLVGRIFSEALKFECQKKCEYKENDDINQLTSDEDDDEDNNVNPPANKKRRMSGEDYSKLPPTLRSNTVRVKVNKCTWVGRDATKGILPWTKTSIIANEVKISDYLIKNITRKYNNRKYEFEFNLECTPSNDIYVNIQPVAPSDDSNEHIYKFLKLYLPALVQKLMCAGEYK